MPSFLLLSNQPPKTPTPLRDRPIAIGRHPDNDIVIMDDLASRFHCIVEPDGPGFRVRDLGSRNGTVLNNDKIDCATLNPGDVIRIGQQTFTFKAGGRPNGEASSTSRGKKKPAAAYETRTGNEADEHLPKGALPPWAKELIDLIKNLPPKDQRNETVTLVDASGRASDALGGEGLGSMSVKLLMLAASKSHATDIHLEPQREALRVRFRVDGQMLNVTELPQKVGERTMGLIRTVCQLKTAARDAVMDGHFSARFTARRVDYRASFTPSIHGQKLVLRVLDLRDAPTSLTEIGMARYMVDRVRKTVHQNQGMMLVCGPTGSGKTTTLYQAMREIDRERRNVITIEDPVEYQLEGVTQIPADTERGNTFGSLLRSVLRQDPDVIFVGEIRDDETARVALQAAMTGHLVFSTLHTKDTIGAVFRLLDLGAERHMVANACDLVLAQRLVRTLCDNCKRPAKLTPAQGSRLGRAAHGIDHVYAATGCAQCLRTGYRGRQALFELLSFNDELRDIVLNNPQISAIKKVIEQGVFTTLLQSGYNLVAKGETSMDEVQRVVGDGGE